LLDERGSDFPGRLQGGSRLRHRPSRSNRPHPAGSSASFSPAPRAGSSARPNNPHRSPQTNPPPLPGLDRVALS
jgi:hypothetical protein